ncbi:MAG TPA: DEAD/DEAH box helicase family protein [Candidatus Aquilonibacter sp.]|nr:DEAD/DEAH box helicase family protein [Candidatus Aquilonibacter sp.]
MAPFIMDDRLKAWKLPLRRWQREAFEVWSCARPKDALIVATPGAGKTRFAARLAHAALADRFVRRLFIVVPREHLKAQTAIALAQAGIRVDHRFENATGGLASDVHGAVITYQQLAAAPSLYRKLTTVPTLVVLDEIHHAGDAATWGSALREAFGGAAHRISLSGTPFRSDGSAIPFVNYRAGECIPDFSYDYADALRDGVCRPLMFPLQGGYAEWVGKDGELHKASFDQALRSKSRMSERLRTVLVHEAWIGDVVEKAHQRLLEIRRTEAPDAGGLMIAMNQEHARFLAGLLRGRTGVEPTIVLSDEDHASRKIASFARSGDPWIVAVHMVSEGVDIPRLRVGVYGSNVVTEMYFRQFCGRFVRAAGSGRQHAFVYLPDDTRLRELAARVTADVRGALNAKRELDELELAQRVRTERGVVDNLFEAIAANVDGERVLDYGPLFNPDAYRAEPEPEPQPFLEPTAEPEDDYVLSPAEEKELLRKSLAALVTQVALRFRVEHKKIHATLNARFGGPIGRASVESLRRRREAALRWLDVNRYDGTT